MLVLDFETEEIIANPAWRAPKPVGLAYKRPGYKSKYLAWGHPEGNTHSFGAVKNFLAKAIADGEQLLFFNAKFDTAVMMQHFGLTPDFTKVEDAMYMVFLHDPYAHSFGLKPSAERILDIPPEERDELKAWILSHIQCAPSEWGAHISKAPVHLVAPYACGDVDRTLALHTRLQPLVPTGAYEREKALLPILMENERVGIRCDLASLEEDTEKYEAALLEVDRRLRKALKSPECNLDSGDELANAMDKAGLVERWIHTPKGKRSTARANLELAIAPQHQTFLRTLQYRGALRHCLSNFSRPWVRLAQEGRGRLHPEWNQIRQEKGARDSKGTRTGRLSSGNPNFQNPPNEYDLVIPDGLPPLPIMRKYLVPDPGYRWLKRDYSQQELRILAHYSEGRLFERYQEDPRIDAHVEGGAIIKEMSGIDLSRKYVKITNFSIIYGSGVPSLASQLGVPTNEAYAIKGAYLFAFPEVRDLMDSCKERGDTGLFITTWGGRIYYVEPPRIEKGVVRRFSYKLLNYLIQGSAADCTKEAIIRWYARRNNGMFLATVHDEVNIQAPVETWREDMRQLRIAMESIEFDVKMLSDGYVGPSWANLKKLELRG